jgi:hypothetical protein
MSIVTSCALPTSAGRIVALVSIETRGRPLSRASRSPTQRVALPQAATSEPSALKMRMNTSAPRDGSSTITWSQPMPARRSASRRASSGPIEIGWARPSSTTKSLPRPFIFQKGIVSGARMRPYMAGWRGNSIHGEGTADGG